MDEQQPHSLGPAVGWETAAEWELEQAAFAAANRTDIPDDVRSLIKQLWRQYCIAAHEAYGSSEEDANEKSILHNHDNLRSGVLSRPFAQLGVWPGDAGPVTGESVPLACMGHSRRSAGDEIDS